MADGDKLLYSALDMNNRRIKEVHDPVEDSDAANRRYVDAKVAGGGGAAMLADLADVDVTQFPPSEGYSLRWYPEAGRASGGRWVAAPQAAGVKVADLTDVNTENAVDGQVLALSGDVWVPVTVAAEPDWAHVPGPVTVEGQPTNSSGTSPLRIAFHDTGLGQVASRIVGYADYAAGRTVSIQTLDQAGNVSSSLGVGVGRVTAGQKGFYGEYTSHPNTINSGTVTNITPQDGIGLGLDPDAPDTMITRAAEGVVAINDKKIVVEKAPGTEGQVLTLDADGAAVWADPPAGGGGADEGPWQVQPDEFSAAGWDFSGLSVQSNGGDDPARWFEGTIAWTSEVTVWDEMGASAVAVLPEGARPGEPLHVSVPLGSGQFFVFDLRPDGRVIPLAGNASFTIPAGTTFTFDPMMTQYWSTKVPLKLDTLEDVSAQYAQDGQTLVYDMGTWSPRTLIPPAEADGKVLVSRSYMPPVWEDPAGGGGAAGTVDGTLTLNDTDSGQAVVFDPSDNGNLNIQVNGFVGFTGNAGKVQFRQQSASGETVAWEFQGTGDDARMYVTGGGNWNFKKVLVESDLAALLDEVTALRSEVQTLRARIG